MNSESEKVRQAASRVQAQVGEKLHKLWWAFLLRGLLAIGLAVCALFWPQQTLGLLTKILGVYFLVDGVAGVIAATRHSDKKSTLLPAIISLATGLVLLFWTAVSARVFLLIVGLWAALQGIGLLTNWWQLDRQDESRTPIGVVGLAILIIGLVFIFWPETGIVAISWLIGLAAAFIGALLIFLATKLKAVRQRVLAVGQNPDEAE